ncbi:hypothetical protein SDRG_03367 [Saprolegnia diclina VS20]|uniref:Dynein regulatory complex subunit 3 n=1 Tax=Saprolegnia diclina (strain VS20) TaxID=1156394 RepID=T0QWU6_SAPDV|nr:hypothetical protein SDRG_03367 [Saprolegnia diclina VS20]EQC39161.1 hypothetical protein SDRG_03367 [Saprolegnia diclina VS20]|eukprot:XP_008607222.1 hypothetical protein SDRG_03367 [Saprolegnia diclina VS20]
MHRLGIRNAEVAVINDEMIQASITKDGVDTLNESAVTDVEGSSPDIDFAKLQVLSLSFRNIFKIDNLLTLRSLTKLQLDNNVIQEIEGIGHLTNLTWLDLSFNNIAEIKGLETLTKLHDLTLYNNNIAKLENLDALKQLQVLSVGNNALGNTEGLLYLKCLEKLRVLNLEGNPVCSDPEYRAFVLAHLDKLKYLDYSLVDMAEVVQAREQYQDELEEMKEVKAIEDAALAREADHAKYTQVLQEASIIILETLLHDMFKEDTEISKIEVLPGLRNLIDDYTEKVKAATEDVKVVLLEKHASIQAACTGFKSQYKKQNDTTQHNSIHACERYKKAVKHLFKQAVATADADVTPVLGQAQAACEGLNTELLEHESLLIEFAQDAIASLESHIETIGIEARAVATDHFRTIETLENHFFDAVTQLAANLLERMATEDGEEDDFLSDECRAILNDRDALNNAINGSHDIHIGKLLAQEDSMREQNVTKIHEVIKTAKDDEWTRNRKRVAEIINMKEKHLSEIAALREELSRTEDEFY